MSRRESFAHRSRNLLSLRAIWDFPVPNCSKCKKRMVRFRVRWACATCTQVDMVRFVEDFVPTIDGGLQMQRRPVVEQVPVGVAYPNRAARRRAA